MSETPDLAAALLESIKRARQRRIDNTPCPDPLVPILDADGQPVVRTVGDLTARHQLARPRIRVAGREGKLKIVKPSDAYPGTVTLIWGDWWEDVALEEPCEVLP